MEAFIGWVQDNGAILFFAWLYAMVRYGGGARALDKRRGKSKWRRVRGKWRRR